MKTALGFRTHSGWAAMVAIEMLPEPAVCHRRTIVLADASIRGAKQPFHTAEPLPLATAKAFLQRCETRSYALALHAIKQNVKTWERRGHEIVACGLIASSARLPGTIESILASHAAIHAAEGELYRDAVAYACERCHLPLLRVKEKELMAAAEAALGISAAQIQHQIASLGRAVGPPWSQDQKSAALVAWMALANAAPRRKRATAGARA